jgi:hypothetical protein
MVDIDSQTNVELRIRGMDCAEEVSVLKRELMPLNSYKRKCSTLLGHVHFPEISDLGRLSGSLEQYSRFADTRLPVVAGDSPTQLS